MSLQVENSGRAVLFSRWVGQTNDDENTLTNNPQMVAFRTGRVKVLIRQLGLIDCILLASCGDGSACGLIASSKDGFERRHFCIAKTIACWFIDIANTLSRVI